MHVLLQVLYTFWVKLIFTFLKGITVTFVTLISAQTAWPASSPGLNYQNENEITDMSKFRVLGQIQHIFCPGATVAGTEEVEKERTRLEGRLLALSVTCTLLHHQSVPYNNGFKRTITFIIKVCQCTTMKLKRI